MYILFVDITILLNKNNIWYPIFEEYTIYKHQHVKSRNSKFWKTTHFCLDFRKELNVPEEERTAELQLVFFRFSILHLKCISSCFIFYHFPTSLYLDWVLHYLTKFQSFKKLSSFYSEYLLYGFFHKFFCLVCFCFCFLIKLLFLEDLVWISTFKILFLMFQFFLSWLHSLCLISLSDHHRYF